MTLGISVIITNTPFYDIIFFTELHILSIHNREFLSCLLYSYYFCGVLMTMEYKSSKIWCVVMSMEVILGHVG